MLHLNQLSFCLKKLLSVFGATAKSHPDDEIDKTRTPKFYKIEEFELHTEIDTINIFKLLEFIKSSKLIHKLQGFVEQYGNSVKINEHEAKKSGITEFLDSIKNKSIPSKEIASITSASNNSEEQTSNPLVGILSFLECLKNSCTDGRICVLPGTTIGQGIIKFVLLNPAAHFHDIGTYISLQYLFVFLFNTIFVCYFTKCIEFPIAKMIVREARSVVLAGGTMEPMSEFIDQLFLMAGATSDRIMTFSCDHVIPKENIIANVVMRGPTGIQFEFNFENRQNTELVNHLISKCYLLILKTFIYKP